MNKDQEKIADFVCRKFGISIIDIFTPTKMPYMQRARATLVYIMKIEGYHSSWVSYILKKPVNTINNNFREIKSELSLPDTNDKLNKLIKETVKDWILEHEIDGVGR